MLDANTAYPIPSFGPLAKSNGQAINPAYPPYPKASSMWTKVTFGFGLPQPRRPRTPGISRCRGPTGNVSVRAH